jgi:hypothetical protein
MDSPSVCGRSSRVELSLRQNLLLGMKLNLPHVVVVVVVVIATIRCYGQFISEYQYEILDERVCHEFSE